MEKETKNKIMRKVFWFDNDGEFITYLIVRKIDSYLEEAKKKGRKEIPISELVEKIKPIIKRLVEETVEETEKELLTDLTRGKRDELKKLVEEIVRKIIFSKDFMIEFTEVAKGYRLRY